MDIKNNEEKKKRGNKKFFSDEFFLKLVGKEVIVEISNKPDTCIFLTIFKSIGRADIIPVNGGTIRKEAILEVKTREQIKRVRKNRTKKVILFHGLTGDNDILDISVLAYDRYDAFLEIPEIYGLKNVFFIQEEENVKWTREKNVFICIIHPSTNLESLA